MKLAIFWVLLYTVLVYFGRQRTKNGGGTRNDVFWYGFAFATLLACICELVEKL